MNSGHVAGAGASVQRGRAWWRRVRLVAGRELKPTLWPAERANRQRERERERGKGELNWALPACRFGRPSGAGFGSATRVRPLAGWRPKAGHSGGVSLETCLLIASLSITRPSNTRRQLPFAALSTEPQWRRPSGAASQPAGRSADWLARWRRRPPPRTHSPAGGRPAAGKVGRAARMHASAGSAAERSGPRAARLRPLYWLRRAGRLAALSGSPAGSASSASSSRGMSLRDEARVACGATRPRRAILSRAGRHWLVGAKHAPARSPAATRPLGGGGSGLGRRRINCRALCGRQELAHAKRLGATLGPTNKGALARRFARILAAEGGTN